MNTIREEMRPRLEAIKKSTNEEIRKLLTPEQQAKFDEFEAKMKERHEKFKERFEE